MRGPASPLPTRDGVGPSCVVLPAGPWATVDACLRAHFPAIDPAEWGRRIEAGDVVDEHGVRVDSARPFKPGMRVYYYRSVAGETRVPFEESVLFRDEFVVVADKPHFLPVTPSGRHLQETLLVRLKRRLGIDTLAPVHRIDRETAGLVLFCIQPAHRGAYQRLFAERKVHKRYECIAPWRGDLPAEHESRLEDDPAHFMRMREVAGPANARTRIELLERQGDCARYALTPSTGKRHQLRVHAAALGIPLRGDRIYPTLLAADSDDHHDPLRLLARELAFEDPVTGTSRHFESRLDLAWPPHQ